VLETPPFSTAMGVCWLGHLAKKQALELGHEGVATCLLVEDPTVRTCVTSARIHLAH